MEQKVIPIILNGKDSAERMKEITDRLETGIQQLFDSDRYKAYLTTMAKFHNYSFNNTLLIAMQGGQLVAGFNKWKDTFHRTVKKGEKGIKILAPAPYKVKQKMEKLDEQGKPESAPSFPRSVAYRLSPKRACPVRPAFPFSA